jgi:arylsulfatase A-like enzyme
MAVGKTHFYPQRVHLGFEELRLYEVQDRDNIGDPSDYHRWLERETGGAVRDTARDLVSNSWLACPWTADERLHPNTWTADVAMELLERRDPTRPFFLQVGFHRPHAPLDPPLHVFEQYADRPLPPVPVGDWAGEYDRPTANLCAEFGRLDDRALDSSRRAYYAQLTHLDYQIGRIYYWLQRRGWLNDTYLIFLSDHGELLGDHHLFRKVTPHEGSAKVPFLIRPPDGAEFDRGATRDEPVTHCDVMPTLLEEARVGTLEGLEGRSLSPLIRGEDAAWREYVHGEHTRERIGWQFVTDGREKFLWDSASGREWFFDLGDDPQETRDRVADPACAERVELWRGRLVAELAKRPEDGLTDGRSLTPGRIPPTVRSWLLEPKTDPDGLTRPPAH